jgi:LuxR family maltose regulon positive regulatory protein
MRRERAGNQRGDWYWRAYRKRDGKLHRIYVGKTGELTLERLDAVARHLFGHTWSHKG